MQSHKHDFMALAIKNAKIAAKKGEVPIAAVIVHKSGEIIAQAHNQIEKNNNPIAHAEIIAIQKAAQKKNAWRLNECDLYVTLEPCNMCAGAILNARIRRLYFAAFDKRAGAVVNGNAILHNAKHIHATEVYAGIRETEAQDILKSFFQSLRQKNKHKNKAIA